MVISEFLESGGYDHHLHTIQREYANNLNLLSQAVTRTFPAAAWFYPIERAVERLGEMAAELSQSKS
jgi:DNA-binding transcriptional MocR family regulator